eukprot:TRINITY_DN13_c0_g1_i5.p1 TRINITY_DN13_c0_g1~~TRINITY_DN13_c0_g1_i5.p1  ORF type:complete len:361 (-),score=73.39 TRINITY_DN13_c0_g1_i5:350-1396(-)
MGNKSGKDKGEKKKKCKGDLKVITLGVAGSGKSTFVKQMKIIGNNGFENEELLSYKDILLKNIMIGIQELVKQAEKLDYQIDSGKRKHARFFNELQVFETEWNEKIGAKVRALWEDKVIQQMWQLAPGYQLQMTQMDYLMANLDRFLQPDFVPSNEDVLHARQRTTGQQTTIIYDQTIKYNWNFIDVGGQKPERAKWTNILTENDCHGVFWFLALDEFNMVSAEDASKTKMLISMELLSELVNYEKTQKLTMIIFLNKIDLFDKKLKNDKDLGDFQKLFPEFKKGDSLQKACDLVKGKVNAFCNIRDPEQLVFYETNALDTPSMGDVFKNVKEKIFFNRLAASGLSTA